MSRVRTGSEGFRWASQLKYESRAIYQSCTNPPGAYINSTRIPRLLVSTGMSAESGQKAGSPITHSAPSTGPITEPMPPITAMATTLNEVSTEKKENSTVE